jgi:hypothetical protein
MSWLPDSLVCLFGLVAFLVLLLALFSPIEALSWWAGWSSREVKLRLPPPDDSPGIVDTRADESRPARSYVVYLTGILSMSGELLGGREIALMDHIADRLPGDEVMIGNVFPYSVTNNPLNGERLLRGLWQWLNERQKNIKNPANPYNWLILLRNLFQVAVSADPRYGPLNNVGVAGEIVRSLFRQEYPRGSGKPVYLVGYSGGGQIAVGAARYLREALQAPIYVIGLGGFFTDDRGIASVTHLYQIKGSRDFFPYIGDVLFPGRWPLLLYSAWNQAKRRGKISVIDAGPMDHFGCSDYFSRSAKFPDDSCYADRTVDLIVKAISGELDG